MQHWLVFQRAINIGKRQYPMAELRAALTGAGFCEVATHIQTGNVSLKSNISDRAELETKLDELLSLDRGFTVENIAFTATDFTDLVGNFSGVAAADPGLTLYLSLLKTPATHAAKATLEAHQHSEEKVKVWGRGVGLLLPPAGYRDAKMTNINVEKIVGTATNRKFTVISAIAKKFLV